jgi:hypothetical protein
MGANREVKSSLFAFLFGEPQATYRLYSILSSHGVHRGKEDTEKVY